MTTINNSINVIPDHKVALSLVDPLTLKKVDSQEETGRERDNLSSSRPRRVLLTQMAPKWTPIEDQSQVLVALVEQLEELVAEQDNPNGAQLVKGLSKAVHLYAHAEPTAANAARVLQKLKKTITSNLALDSMLSDKLDRLLTPDEPTAESSFKHLLEMIAELLKVTVAIGNNQSLRGLDQQSFLEKIGAAVQNATTQSSNRLHDQINDQIAESQAFSWGRLGTILLGAIAIAATFAFLGPVAAAIVAGMVVLQETGAMDKIFSGIENPTARAAAKLGFCIGLSILGGGVAGLVDGAIASAVDVAASGASTLTSTATAVVSRGAASLGDMEMTEMGELAAETAGRQIDSVVAESEGASSATWGQVAKGSFITNAKNIAFQSFFSSNVITDIVNAVVNPGKDPVKKQVALWLSFVLNIAAAIGGMGLTALGNSQPGAANIFLERLGEVGNRSTALSLVNNSLNLIRNPYFLTGMTLACTVYSASWTGVLASIQNRMSHRETESGVIDSNLQTVLTLTMICNQWMKQTLESGVKVLQNSQNSMNFQDLTTQGLSIAKIFTK